MAELRIELLGGFRVAVGQRAIPAAAWRRRKPAAVLKLLALAPGHRLHREQLMDALWPELDPRAAAANLRKAVHEARRVLDTEHGAQLLTSTGELLALPSEGLWVDVDAFRAAVDRGRRDRDADSYAAAIELYGDGLLPEDRYDEWALARRDELNAELVAALEELAAILESRGELDAAIRVVRRLAAVEPLEERPQIWLMRLDALAGRHRDALRRYEQFRGRKQAELGSDPSPELQRLYEEVRAKQATEPELTMELWERVGDLRVLSGDATGAAKAFASAIDVGLSADVGRLHRKAAAAHLGQHDAEGAAMHLEAAERLGPDPDERARVACLRANEAWERGDLEAAQRFAEQARELADLHGDPEDVAAAHETLAIVSHFRGEWRQGLQVEIARLAGNGVGAAPLARVFDIHHCIGQYHLYGDGLWENVEDYARHTLELAEQAQAVRAQAFAWCLLGESLLLQARWEEAAGCLERSCDLHASLGTRSGALPWQRRAELAVCRGAPGEADAPLRRASAIATVSPMARHLWGRIHATAALASLERGDPETAIAAVRAAAPAFARYGDCPSCSALLNPVAAEAFAAVGDAESAGAYAHAAAGVADHFASSAWRAMAESAAGSAALADGKPRRARERFEAAAALYRGAGQPHWTERSLARATASERRERSGNRPVVASSRRSTKEVS